MNIKIISKYDLYLKENEIKDFWAVIKNVFKKVSNFVFALKNLTYTLKSILKHAAMYDIISIKIYKILIFC